MEVLGILGRRRAKGQGPWDKGIRAEGRAGRRGLQILVLRLVRDLARKVGCASNFLRKRARG